MGGLFCALSIFHHCKDKVKIEVYEQAAQYLEIGAGVGLGINGARLIHHLGLGDELNAIAGFRQGVWISFRRYDNGEEIVSVPSNDTGKVRQAPVARSDALDLFRMAVEQRGAATLHTKKRFQRVEDNGEDVTIHFADGTTAMADLVIGSDGIHSGVRNQFIDDKSVYSGQVAYRATIPTSELKDWPLQSYSAMWCAKHKHFLTFPIAQNKTLNVVAFLNAHGRDAEKVAESWTSVCDRKDVEEDFKDFEPIVQRIISLMPEKPSKWRINDREPLNKWHYMGGKVMLLGDAAHASKSSVTCPTIIMANSHPLSATTHGRRRGPGHRGWMGSRQDSRRFPRWKWNRYICRSRGLCCLLPGCEATTSSAGTEKLETSWCNI